VYTILIEKESFSALADFPEFASEVENINIVVSYFERRLERIDDNSVLSVTQVLSVIEAGAQALPDNTLKKLPGIRCAFAERSDTGTFCRPLIRAIIQDGQWTGALGQTAPDR